MALNVLQILVDQHHPEWLGCAGHPHAQTPHLDALAAEGQRWSRWHCPAPLCTPSRVSILSGQACLNHGYYGIAGPTPAGLPSAFGHFKAHGYRTGGIGKLHLPKTPRVWGSEHLDFYEDSQAVTDASGRNAYDAYLDGHGLLELDDHKGFKNVPELQGVQRHWEGRPSQLPLEHCVEAWIAKRALHFIDQRDESGDKPFFLQLSFPRPHHALTPDRTFWEKVPEDVPLPPSAKVDVSGRSPNFRERIEEHRREIDWLDEPRDYEGGLRRTWRATLALVAQNDHFIGQILAGLKERGLDGNTIVVFAADHGAYQGEYGILEKAPGINSDAVCRVPVIWRVPGLARTGECPAPATHVDMVPTLTELCGLPPLPTADGESLARVLRDGPQEADFERPAVTEFPTSKSIRLGPWRLVHFHRKVFGGEDVGELYNLDEDPLEERNRYHDADCQPVVHELRRRLLEWLTETRRVATAWPPVEGAPAEPEADGTEATGGLWKRLEQGVSNTFDPRDYL